MKKVSIFVACLLVSVLMLSGCASIFKGTRQDLTFESNPEGAKVYLDGKLMGVTPFTMPVKKAKYTTLRVEKEGYITVERDLKRTYDFVALLDVFWDCSTTDAISGAAFPYKDNSYYFELTKKE